MSGFFITGSDGAQAQADSFDRMAGRDGPPPLNVDAFANIGPELQRAARQVPNRLGIAVNQTFNWLALDCRRAQPINPHPSPSPR